MHVQRKCYASFYKLMGYYNAHKIRCHIHFSKDCTLLHIPYVPTPSLRTSLSEKIYEFCFNYGYWDLQHTEDQTASFPYYFNYYLWKNVLEGE